MYLLVSVLLALAPPPALREPLEEEEPSESDDELLMLSLSWPRPQDVAAQPPRSGRRLRVGELSEVVSGALLSILAMPVQTPCKSLHVSHHYYVWCYEAVSESRTFLDIFGFKLYVEKYHIYDLV